jgi:heme/copper-type cytochrome/quinol oxidase subunit 4
MRTAIAGMSRDPVVIVWGVLVAVTLLSFWVGSDHDLSAAQGRSVLVLILAFIKVRFIGLYFMGLRDSPTALRAAFEAWCIVVCAVLVGFFLVG